MNTYINTVPYFKNPPAGLPKTPCRERRMDIVRSVPPENPRKSKIMRLIGGETFKVGTVDVEVTGFKKKHIVARHGGAPIGYLGVPVGGKIKFGEGAIFQLAAYGNTACVLRALPGCTICRAA